jgi:hypothetical protein
MKEGTRRVSDFFPEAVEVVDIDDLLDRDIEIIDFEARKGAFGDYLAVYFRDLNSDEIKTFTTGANVVVRKLKTIKERNGFPVIGKVKKVKRYYDIV